MNLVRLALERYQFTLVVLVLLAALGIASFVTMPRSEDPQFNFPAASVVAVFPGAGPADMEQLVVDPLEDRIDELEDIKKVETIIEDGVSVTSVEFLQGTDPDDAYADVSEAVADARRELPDGIAALRVRKQSPTDVNVLQVAVIGDSVTSSELRRHAEDLEQALERVDGVKRAEVWGLPEERIEVALDFDRMDAAGVSFPQIAGALREAGANVPGGDLDVGSRRYNVKTTGDYETIDQIRRTVVRSTDEGTVYLDDVAAIEFAYDDDGYRARADGRRAAFVTMVQREGTNIFTVMKGARAALEHVRGTLPDGMEMTVIFDQSASVATRVNGFFVNLLQGVFLVGLVVLLAMGLRTSIIVMLAIPFSLLIALGWLDSAGYGLQQMSIVGLVIALGLLVDNAIVVTENIARLRKSGVGGLEGAMRGAGEVAWPIVSSTATTVLAFVPMVLLKTGTGDFIRSMPLVVIYALLASLLVSLTLTPLLAGRIGAVRAEREGHRRPRPFERLLDMLATRTYRGTLSRALAHPGRVLIIATVVFAASMGLFPFVGVSLFPKAEKPQLLVNVDLPEGSSLDRTDALAGEVETAVRSQPGVLSVATNVGHGNPRVYYNAFPKNENATHAQLLVELDPETDWSLIAHALRESLATIPGADIEVKEFMQGPPVKAPIAISVVGDDLDVLRREAERVEKVMRETPGTTNVENPSRRFRTDLRVAVNRDKAGQLGVPLDAIDQTVRAGLAGVPITTFRDPDGDEYPVMLTMPDDGRPSVRAFDRMDVPSRSGTAVPVRQVARLTFESSPVRIEHLGLERVAPVTADVQDGANVAEVTAAVLEKLASDPLPPGYRYHIGGEEESREESFGGMGQALLIALLGIFAVLVLQFGSFRQPLIVFAAIPFAITGALGALLLSGYTFSFTAFVGLTSLVGIVVNNSIILVDYANRLRSEGRTVFEAVREAGEARFLPIVLTTLTTIGGLLPLTLTGSTMWAPMGWAIIGGLAVSTVLTLVVVPVLYQLLTPEAAPARK